MPLCSEILCFSYFTACLVKIDFYRVFTSKFVIAVNPKANPTTWTLIEFTDRGSQGCVLGWGVGNINIAITQDQPQGTKVDYSVYGQVH